MKIQTEIAVLDVSNCQFVRIECSKSIGAINIERSKGCVVELNNTIEYADITVAACLDVKFVQSTVEVRPIFVFVFVDD